MKSYKNAILYIYPSIDEIVEQYEDIIVKKAENSYMDLSPCEKIANKIIDLIYEKNLLIELKVLLDKVLKNLTDSEMMYFEYKYFKRKPKSFFEGFDVSSRQYFRNQLKVFKKYSNLLDKYKMNEKWFEDYLKINFIKELCVRLEIREKEKEEINKQRIKAILRSKKENSFEEKEQKKAAL